MNCLVGKGRKKRNRGMGWRPFFEYAWGAWITEWFNTWLWTLERCNLGHEFKPQREQKFFGLSTTPTLKNFHKRMRSRQETQLLIPSSVTRLGDLLDFGQLFKAFGKNWFVQISHILRQSLGVKIYHFSSEFILGNFHRHLAIFFWSHWYHHLLIICKLCCLWKLKITKMEIKHL